LIKSRTRLLLTLLVLLAGVAEASPQTTQSGPPTRQMVVGKTRKSGNSRSSLATGTMPGLCFQPGVGWQRMPTEQPSEPAARDTNTSLGLAASEANPPSIYPRPSNTKPPRSAECAGILTDKKVLGARVDRFTILNRPGSIGSARPTKPGTVTSLQVNGPYHANGNAGLESVKTTQSAMPSASTYFASEAGPDAQSDQVNSRAYRAYISPIKLRRLIRNAPDFRTRIKLEQLENHPPTPLRHPGVDSKTDAVARSAVNGERVRPPSSRRADAHARPQGPRTLLSPAYR
jgi:hypothetical protein